MALIKFGGGITAMSGSIAGNTFARNRFGFYSRSRTKPVNPKSPGQSLMRLILGHLVEAWHDELDATQRSAWATYANAISMKNRLGENIKCTGFNHFLRGNSLTLQQGQPMIENGPTELSLPPTDPTYKVEASAATQKISVTFDNTQDWAAQAQGFMVCFMGRPQIETRNFFNGPWRLTGSQFGIPVPPPSPFLVTAVFTLIAGQRIWVSARIVEDDARCTIRFQDDCIVGA